MAFIEKIQVTVIMVTYNHEKYIAEAIEGVLMQEVDFPIELIVADDCSPDGTPEIIQNVIDNHPKGHWVNYTRHQMNKGMMPNFIWALEKAKGKYIALCEGDDYWVDPLKLQKQVDFLEANEDFSICFHPVEILENGEIYPDDLEKVAGETTILDLAKGNFINTPSVMFRRENIKNLPKELLRFPAGDYALHMFNAQFGKIEKLSEPMAVYRIHSGGIWSSQAIHETNKKWLLQLTLMNSIISDLKALEIMNEKLLNNIQKFKTFPPETFDTFENIEDLKLLCSIVTKELKTQSNSLKTAPYFLSKEVRITILLKAILLKIFKRN